ncbi:bi-domain-containing oxidoreductase [Candidatus Peregrinibacteria bacterium]|nr:bi-domain-containing oxidoreductase [Candidatus Peregrinibacteria bacterium]
MNQALVQKGNIVLEEVPLPAISANEVLVKTHYSLISTGTELAGISMSKESLLTRALKQPHNLKKVMKMAADRGIIKTYKIIKGMLDFGTPTGYSLAGEVIEVGENITDIKKGDLVACSGAGIANHAEYVAVPRLLASRIPNGLDLKQAASVTLGAIAMQGVRQANPKFGESVAVVGLGLLGQLTCQILKAAGCKVIGIDISAGRCGLAKKCGADFTFTGVSMNEIKRITDGFGVDAAIITASTDSNEPLNQAMEMTRKKGTVVVVGAVGLNLSRSPWYEKEIDLKISCSYGPGRYDATYEEEMLDYPLPYVRWTENRNMEEYLRLLVDGKVNFTNLHPQEFKFSEAVAAYEKLKTEKPLAVILSYRPSRSEATGLMRPEGVPFDSHKKEAPENKVFLNSKKLEKNGKIGIAVIGAGAFASTTHLPNIGKLGKLFKLKAVVAKKGVHAKQFAKQYDAEYCTTDYQEVLKDKDIDAVIIATRHDTHAKMTLEALKAGKAVLVEKPLALNKEELSKIWEFFKNPHSAPHPSPPTLLVGFNRRFSPFAKRVCELTQNRKNPLIINFRVNAGYLPLDHWTQTAQGGGRVIGEACHFFDLFKFWTSGARVTKIEAQSINPQTKDVAAQDNFSATIKYEDGSVCTLLYTALGNKNLPKEYAEIFCDGKVMILDDFRSLKVVGGSGSLKMFGQDKGHFAELEAFAHAIKTGEAPIKLEDIFDTSELSFEVNKQVTHG